MGEVSAEVAVGGVGATEEDLEGVIYCSGVVGQVGGVLEMGR